MEPFKPTPLKKFIINTTNHTLPSIIKETFLSREKFLKVGKSVLKLEVSIILTIIINILLNKSDLYKNYIKNIKPSTLKIGSLKIKTRKLITMLIKYLILTFIFTIIVFLI